MYLSQAYLIWEKIQRCGGGRFFKFDLRFVDVALTMLHLLEVLMLNVVVEVKPGRVG